MWMKLVIENVCVCFCICIDIRTTYNNNNNTIFISTTYDNIIFCTITYGDI